MRQRKIVYGLIIITPFLSLDALGDVIINSFVSGTAGTYSYAYEIENVANTGVLLFSLMLTGNVESVQSPAGWVSAALPQGPLETRVAWLSTDVQYDVPALGILSGFVITSDSRAGIVTFSTFDDNFSEFDGQTTGPVASTVPEPRSIILLSIGLIAIYIVRCGAAKGQSFGTGCKKPLFCLSATVSASRISAASPGVRSSVSGSGSALPPPVNRTYRKKQVAVKDPL